MKRQTYTMYHSIASNAGTEKGIGFSWREGVR